MNPNNREIQKRDRERSPLGDRRAERIANSFMGTGYTLLSSGVTQGHKRYSLAKVIAPLDGAPPQDAVIETVYISAVRKEIVKRAFTKRDFLLMMEMLGVNAEIKRVDEYSFQEIDVFRKPLKIGMGVKVSSQDGMWEKWGTVVDVLPAFIVPNRSKLMYWCEGEVTDTMMKPLPNDRYVIEAIGGAYTVIPATENYIFQLYKEGSK